MNRIVWVIVLAALGLPALPTRAADEAATSAESLAAKQDAEERYSRLRGTVDDLLAAQASLQKRLAALADELASVREQNHQSGSTYATREDLRRLAEKLQEIDRKREEDKRLILEELRKLASATPPEPPPKRSAAPLTPVEEPSTTPQKGYDYVVKKGDTLAAVVAAYQQSGVKVTLDQVLKANPNVKANRLHIGQKIFIPDPNQAAGKEAKK